MYPEINNGSPEITYRKVCRRSGELIKTRVIPTVAHTNATRMLLLRW
jgi:hypothetical protein